VNRGDSSISELAVHVGNRPGKRGVSHWNGGDGGSLGVAGRLEKVTTCPSGRERREDP
jgi:hypothetical protein